MWQSGRMRATRNRVYGQPYQGFESLRLRHNKKTRPTGVFFIVFDNVDSNPGQRVRTAAKRRTGVRRFARMRKFSMVFIAHPRVVTRFSPLQNGVYTLARHRRAFNAYCIHAETSTGAKNLTFTKITITYEPNKGSPMNRI